MFRTCLNALAKFGRIIVIGMISQVYRHGTVSYTSGSPAFFSKIKIISQREMLEESI
jgi:NADPH-dependent curcumin reductase CurA